MPEDVAEVWITRKTQVFDSTERYSSLRSLHVMCISSHLNCLPKLFCEKLTFPQVSPGLAVL